MTTRKGRPPIAKERKQFTLTISKSDFDLLREIGDLSGSTPSAMIRELLEDNIPTFIDIRDALLDAKAGNADRAFARMEKRLKREIKRSSDSQREMFDERK